MAKSLFYMTRTISKGGFLQHLAGRRLIHKLHSLVYSFATQTSQRTRQLTANNPRGHGVLLNPVARARVVDFAATLG